MEQVIQVEAKVLGQRSSGFNARTVAIADIGTNPTLQALIEAVVAAEVSAISERVEEREFVRLLTEAELAAETAIGKVSSGGQDPQVDVEVDVEAAIETALLAHTDGLFIVVVDDEEITRLDRRVKLTAGSAVLFLRLVALAGGWR